MPSPRERPKQPPGVCWPTCTSATPPVVLDSRFQAGGDAGYGNVIRPLSMPPPVAAQPVMKENGVQLQVPQDEAVGKADIVLTVREDLSLMQKQLALLIEGQAELQESVLKVSSVILDGKSPVRMPLVEITQKSVGPKKSVKAPKNEKVEAAGENGDVNHRVSQSHADPGAQLRKKALHKMFKDAEESNRSLSQLKRETNGSILGMVQERFSKDQLEITVDTVMAVVIAINAVFIGIAMDYSDSSLPWVAVDLSFSILFITELAIKVALHGFTAHFCGAGSLANWADCFLIFIDLLQLMIDIFARGAAQILEDAPSASLFRMVRLLKIARVLRLLKTDVFKDLLDMIQGILGGISTLMWSMVFFVMIVYVSALLFRETLGRQEYLENHKWFKSVPRSMFSTFRCSFGDCSTAGGTPIFEFEDDEESEGMAYSLIYCLFVFSVTIGLFNVISAIFVESTMAAASKMATAKKRQRLQDEKLLARRVTELIKCMLRHSKQDEVFSGRALSQFVDELFEIEVPRSVIDDTIKDPIAIAALDDLDINPQDRARLSDIFDPDNGGTVCLSDVAAGIRRLRGDPRRSDIVCVDLMIRSLQGQILELRDSLSPPESEE